LKSRLQSAASRKGEALVCTKWPILQIRTHILKGNGKNRNRSTEKRRARIFNERLDSSMAQNCVSQTSTHLIPKLTETDQILCSCSCLWSSCNGWWLRKCCEIGHMDKPLSHADGLQPYRRSVSTTRLTSAGYQPSGRSGGTRTYSEVPSILVNTYSVERGLDGDERYPKPHGSQFREFGSVRDNTSSGFLAYDTYNRIDMAARKMRYIRRSRGFLQMVVLAHKYSAERTSTRRGLRNPQSF
jgi:hypothetical protein